MRSSFRFFSIVSLSLFLFVLGCMGPDSRQSNANASGELQDLQKFTLNNLKNESVSLDGLLKQNKAVLINFWATWCPPCREEIPGLIKLQEKFKNRSFTILGVDVGESKSKVSSFAEKIGINYPVVLDSGMAVAERYSVVGIPTSFLVSSKGKILGEYHAYTPKLEADVEKALLTNV
jgi:peroxiredoxin